MRSHTYAAAIAFMVAHVASAHVSFAQGCILLRQTSPLFGTSATDQEVGTWTITFTGRNSTADKHYNGSVRQIQREREGTYVVNRQNSLTATLGYQFSPRVSFFVGVPFIEASWGIPSPRNGGPAARANENAHGVGDITTLARVALFDRTSHRTWNLLIGGGVKVPTGKNHATDVFPDGNGNNNLERYVDISVQPGDGGWGGILDLQGYKSLGRFVLYGTGTWLSNPRDTGGPSRGNLPTDARPSNVNTVSDQFLFRAGATVGVFKYLAASISWRMEGVPRYDMFGPSNGFRRPGVTMYWEPGVTVASGRHSVSFNLPVGYYYNRFRNPNTGLPGDSTFPEYVAIATYSARLGRTPAKEKVRTNQHSQPMPEPPKPDDRGPNCEK